MERYRMPAAVVEPVETRSGTEIRFPAQSGCRSTRARKEENT